MRVCALPRRKITVCWQHCSDELAAQSTTDWRYFSSVAENLAYQIHSREKMALLMSSRFPPNRSLIFFIFLFSCKMGKNQRQSKWGVQWPPLHFGWHSDLTLWRDVRKSCSDCLSYYYYYFFARLMVVQQWQTLANQFKRVLSFKILLFGLSFLMFS